jgi:hypothetical protein
MTPKRAGRPAQQNLPFHRHLTEPEGAELACAWQVEVVLGPQE